jgi:16S rRNA (cytosine967-C5)-methyltransferase
VRAAAARAIEAVTGQGRSLDAAFADAERDVAPGDRALLRMLCYGVLRHHWRLSDWLDALLDRPLKRRDGAVHALLVAGLYQLHDTRIPDHAVVSESVAAARVLRRPQHAPLVNAVLRRARRDRIFDRPPSNDEARYDHPRWLLDALRADWPDDWEAIVAANNDRAPMWLRTNPNHGSAGDYVRRLEAAGIAGATLLAAAPQAVRLAEPVPVDDLPGFAAGQVSVQDAAAQLAAPWLLAGLEGRVLDACAAPGGKSGHLLELGGGRIELTCLDRDAERLEGVAANLDRLGFDATLVAADASKPGEWWDGAPYRAILVDAPCSASGVIRRHPDSKRLRRATDIPALAGVQRELLEALWPLLVPGGRILYVTCSVLAAENEAVAGEFRDHRADGGSKRQDEAVLQDYNIRDLMRPRACGHQILPGTDGLDGFYFAGFVKTS